MKIVRYAPEHFDRLVDAARRSASARSLQHRPFVDYYYATRETCRLYLALDGNGAVLATIGVEDLPFQYHDRQLHIGFASNFVAFRPGAGGYMFLHWMKSSDFACTYGGSRDTHKILRNQRWTYFAGVKTFFLNRRYTADREEPLWRRTAKSVVRAVAPRVDPRSWPDKVERSTGGCITVHEEKTFTDDMLPPGGRFALRFSPSAEYLNWRYGTALPFVRYRVFRIVAAGATSGYVVFNERPGRLIVSQCDGVDPVVLTHGLLLAIAAAGSRSACPMEVLLTSAHTQMQRRLREFGFQSARADRPFALGSLRYPLDLDPDTSEWLINFDWTDNGLRAPFLDQETTRESVPTKETTWPLES